MKRSTRLLCGLLLLVTAPLFAAPQLVPAAPNIAARGFILQDFHSGRVLVEHNADERMDPASLTKLMTAYVVFHELRAGNISLEEKTRVSEKAWRTPGSRMFIEVATQVSIEELLKGMIIQSGNDASVALAEFLAGSEDAFAALMNDHARRLGMTGTNFANSTGLPGTEHYTTPRDMAIMARALIREFPEHYSWYSVRNYTYNGITQYNRNRLLWRDESVDGMKTGHTDAAGYCLVASALRNDMRLVSVVLGTASENARAAETQKLLNYGFRFFETHRLYEAREALTEMRIWQGARATLPLGLAEDLYVTVPRGQYNRLQASMALEPVISAPASEGQQYGTVQLSLGEELITEQPLIALADVEQGGLWQRLIDGIKLLFH